jgi:NhaA family Na+:H+ antiporter
MTRILDAIRFAADRYLALPIGVVIALAWANLRPESYFTCAHALSFAVNDVAMLFFFALVTGEIIEATRRGGALESWKHAALPVVGAVGGVGGSALAYVLYLRMGDEASVLMRGWPIPCAADLTFGYFIARTICRRHPAIPFFLLLGITSDILGLVIVELRFPALDGQPVGALLVAAGIISALALRLRRVEYVWPYILVSGALSWLGLFVSGLQPSIALVPIVPFLAQPTPAGRRFTDVAVDVQDGVSRFVRQSRYPVQAIVLLFGLVNAGAAISGFGTGTWAVAIAALAGKPAGVLGAVGVAVAFGLRLPHRVGWRELIVVALTASIGFTFALFFATASIPLGPVLVEAKLGALLTLGGAVLALAAAAVLRVGLFERATVVSTGELDAVFGSTVDVV